VVEAADLERGAADMLAQLIRFNTVNPPGNERPAQEFLSERLTAAGFKCETFAVTDDRPNLVAELGSGVDGPRLAFLGHVDTVPAEADDWHVDPWSGELHDGCVWGRGALDMKGQVASEVAAACALAEAGWRPESGSLVVIAVCDEEAGSAKGAGWLCKTVPERVRCDLLVNEGGGASFEFDGRRLYTVAVAEKGVFRFTLTTRGRAGHASIPRIADNALTKLAPLISAVAEARPALEPSPEPQAFIDALGVDGSGDLAAALAAVERADPRVALMLEPTLAVTFAPTMVEASESINVIPARARLRVDCRVPPGLGADHALERIRQAVGDADYEVEFDEQVVGNRSPMESELMDHIREFVEREDPGAAVTPAVLPGFTDSRWFREAFPDCVAYGFFPMRSMDLFESMPLIHGVDERVPVADLGLAARFYAELATRVLA
jgi:acetylornithine deacetylase/succinyl-diaminopimelate desuccinylase-like protein